MFIYLAMLETDEDKTLFAELYTKYYSEMLSVALGILKETHLAEDAVHEAFLRIAENFEKYFPKSGHKPGGLCVVIVKHISIDMLRRSRLVVPEPEMDVRAEAPLPEDVVISYEQHLALTDMIASLDDSFRGAVTMKLVQGLSYSEISALLGISQDTVRKRVQRGRAKLIQALERG